MSVMICPVLAWLPRILVVSHSFNSILRRTYCRSDVLATIQPAGNPPHRPDQQQTDAEATLVHVASGRWSRPRRIEAPRTIRFFHMTSTKIDSTGPPDVTPSRLVYFCRCADAIVLVAVGW
mmetsp:Transcript_31902/g.69056  ORF Transcript_31902/g.69056 Transcript_31902/m.69056 type:complete len:121 (+) Transcript_31902:112-474(+)